MLEYLFRVVLFLFAFGGVAVILFWALEVVSAIRSEIVEKWSGGENDL